MTESSVLELILGALSDVFDSWNFCWVLEVMLLGVLSDVVDSWKSCWVLEVMLLILGTWVLEVMLLDHLLGS